MARDSATVIESEPPWIEGTTLAELPLRAASTWPDAEALVYPDARWTYAELAEQITDCARALVGMGVTRGDRVGLLMPNSAEMLISLFGASMLGAVVVPVNSRFRARELAHVIGTAGISVLLARDAVDEQVDFVTRLGEALPSLSTATDPERLALAEAPDLRAVVLFGETPAPGFLSGEAFAERAASVTREQVLDLRLSVRIRDVALMLFTSGTTAYPKGCLLTHEGLVRVWCSVGRRLGISREDRVFDPLPLFHLAGIGPTIFTWAVGGTMISMPHFQGPAGLDLIEQERATWLYTMFPPVTMGLIRDPSFPDRDVSHVRGIMNVAPVETLQVIRAAFPAAEHMCGPFGMTEASGAITCHVPGGDPDAALESSGPPLPGVRMRVVDPSTGADLPSGATGELLIHSHGLMEGYHANPDATAAAVDEGGWLHSGDLGFVDERGWVTYTGRLKEMIKVGGENVSPLEVEAHLSTHPAIKLVVVVGVPDDRLGEVPAAFVELADGHELDAVGVIGFCRGQIAGFRVPRHVRFVTEWPMSATKVQRQRLQADLVAELAIGATP